MVSNDNETYLGFDLSTQKVRILFKNKQKIILIKSGVMVGITVFLEVCSVNGSRTFFIMQNFTVTYFKMT